MIQEKVGPRQAEQEPTELDPNVFISRLFEAQWRARNELRRAREEELEKKGEPFVERLSAAPIPNDFGDWTQVVYGDKRDGSEHEVMVYGDLQNGAIGAGEEMLVRVHSSHRPNEVWGAHTSDDKEQLEEAMKRIQKAGRGIIVYLEDEGRGHGVVGQHKQFQNMFEWTIDPQTKKHKIVQKRDPETKEVIHTSKAYQAAGLPDEARGFKHVGHILKDLRVNSVRLMTNNLKKRDGLIEAGVNVVGIDPLDVEVKSPTAKDYQHYQRTNGNGYLPMQATVYNGR
ncbi:MAG: hypothetical protein ACREHC_05040 [Candidatus Levyibacteriota bacterium]